MKAFVVDLLFLAAVGAALIAREADASTLYALHQDPALGEAVSELNPANSTATRLIADLPFRPVWADIAARPGDVTRLYAVSRLPGARFDSALSTIDLDTGALSDLFTFNASGLGYASPYILEVSGLAIPASQPSVATVSATLFNSTTFERSQLLFDLDLDTGVRSNVQTLTTSRPTGLSELLDLTYAPDGTLFTNAADAGTSTSYSISTIDRSDGSVDPDPRYSCCSAPWSIEIDPLSGQLHALEQMATTTGDVVGVDGLAFIVPEPGTGALLVLGLVGYGLGSNGRGGSRQRSRRA